MNYWFISLWVTFFSAFEFSFEKVKSVLIFFVVFPHYVTFKIVFYKSSCSGWYIHKVFFLIYFLPICGDNQQFLTHFHLFCLKKNPYGPLAVNNSHVPSLIIFCIFWSTAKNPCALIFLIVFSSYSIYCIEVYIWSWNPFLLYPCSAG